MATHRGTAAARTPGAVAPTSATSTAVERGSWVSEARQRDWLKTMRPWSLFVGLQDRKPLSVPTTVEVELRGAV